MADLAFVVVELVDLVVYSRIDWEVVLGVEMEVAFGSASFDDIVFVVVRVD